MQISVNKNNIKHVVRENISLVVAGLFVPIMTFILVGTYGNHAQKVQDLELLTTEVTELSSQADAIKTNKRLIDADIDRFNSALRQLIPEEEDFFTIIYALELLGQKTGFPITGYTITPTEIDTEKVTLTVSGNGDAEAFVKLLEEFNFGGGRLITNEKIEFGQTALGATQLKLNFYHKKSVVSGGFTSLIPKKDIDLIRTIVSKTTILPTQSNFDTSYPTKGNPF